MFPIPMAVTIASFALDSSEQVSQQETCFCPTLYLIAPEKPDVISDFLLEITQN